MTAVLHPFVLGVNHRSAPLGLRDLLFVEDAQQPQALGELIRLGLEQTLLVSTCDRIELWGLHEQPAQIVPRLRGWFVLRAGAQASALEQALYQLEGQDALRHQFAVAASLDSQMIGDPHVLGQVKACQRFSREAGCCGPALESLLAAAYGAAKRVRNETAVGEQPVSIAAAAARFAIDLHGDLKRCDGVLIGAGDMGEVVAEHFLSGGLRRLVVTAPRASRAEALAQTLSCHSAPWADLPVLLAGADIVLTAVGGRTPLLSAEMMQQALRKRRRKPVFLIDAALPGDIDPAVNRVEGAYLYDLTDLERGAMEGRASREAAAHRGWDILDQELEKYSKGQAARGAVPLLVALRQHGDVLRQQALLDAGNDADRATTLLLNRLLHDPSRMLKEMAADPALAKDWAQAEILLKKLFGLSSP